MATTPKLALRYPSASDAPDGPGAFYNLAQDVETALTIASTIGGVDLNTLTTASGAYRGSGFTNAPAGSSGSWLILVNTTGGNMSQIAWSMTSGATYSRVSQTSGSTWTAWAPMTPTDTGWAFGSNFSLASGWSTLVDPNGVGSGTGLAGGIRLVGKQLELRFRVNRTGATLTADSSGNLADTLVCTVNTAAYQPTSAIYDNFYVIGVRQGTVRLGTDGAVTITDMVPNGTVSNNDTIQVGIRGFVD